MQKLHLTNISHYFKDMACEPHPRCRDGYSSMTSKFLTHYNAIFYPSYQSLILTAVFSFPYI